MNYTYVSNIRTNNMAYLNNTSPCTLCKSGLGEMTGYPTPIQFFPEQEPINVSQNTNLRQMYKRTYWNYSTNINNKQIGNSVTDSVSRLNRIKSKNLGKYVYKVGLPQNALISTKSYNPSTTRTTLNRVRSNI